MKKSLAFIGMAFLGAGMMWTLQNFGTDQSVQQPPTAQTSTPMLPASYNINNLGAAVEQTDFTMAAEKTVDAVVHIKNTAVGSRSYQSIWDLFSDQPRERMQIGMGSGVIVSPDGYIITNNHVIENASEIEVTTNDNKTYEATLIGTDPNSDIAVLKIVGDHVFPFVRFADSDQTRIGEWVLAVGNPFNLTSTVTAGIISAKSRDLNDYDQKNQSFIQTDAAVNSGNSGGALVNVRGDLVGINTAITSATGAYIGYAFAVPSNIARKVFEDLIEYGNVQKGLLGVSGSSLNANVAERLGLDQTEGFYVDSVVDDMGAAMAGIRSGDIILFIDAVKINKFSDMTGYLNSKRPGDSVMVRYRRNGDENQAMVTLMKSKYTQLFGMQLSEISEKEAKAFGIDGGVKVTQNNNQGLMRMGIVEGYVLTKFNDKPIQSLEEIEQLRGQNPYLLEFLNTEGEVERIRFE